jgi:hypothetical protein
MLKKPLLALCCALLAFGGCAQLDEWTSTSPSRSNSAAGAANAPRTDALYINTEARAGTGPLRNIYIAPANLANMQVIQPEGSSSDAEWWVTDQEAEILQRAITYEYTLALGNKSAFNIVNTPQQADLIVNTAVIAVHPNEARARTARDGRPGGAITASIAVVNTASEAVLVRSVDTVPSDNIWAFNQVHGEDAALNQVFRNWGDSIRLGLLTLQGRNTDPSLQ